MAITHPDFPATYDPVTHTWSAGNGPDPKVATTPMDPYHVVDHNSLKQAINEHKTEINAISGKGGSWLPANVGGTPKIDVPNNWGAVDDSMYVSGTVYFGSITSPPSAGTRTAWTPTLRIANSSTGGGGGTFNASTVCHYTVLAGNVVHVEIAIKSTGSWTGQPFELTFPSSFAQGTMQEQFLTGMATNVYRGYGIHMPIIGVVHGVKQSDGGAVDGFTLTPPTVRIIGPSV